MKGKRLLINTIFMTATSLILRMAGLMFQVFLSRKMGAAGIGLFQLVMSVNSFAATLAISGIRFATTRLVSEELGRGRSGNVTAVVKRCLIYAVLFGTLTSLILYFSADTIGLRFIGEARTVLSLRILGISMPFLSAGAVLGGYFTGVCRIGRSAIASFSEEFFKIAVSMLLLNMIPSGNVELTCAAVVSGNVAGEVLSFFVIYVMYRIDKKLYITGESKKTGNITRRMLGIAMPLALSAYARTALTTVQNILVPKGFKRSGASTESALADYGMIQGMVFPVITFPSVLFSSVSELIVPELTEEQMKGREDRISNAANMLLKLCLLFSVGVMGALLCFSGELGRVIYKSDSVGGYIKLFAFLMPIMYMDTVTDGMLRGLGQHMYSMRINIIDSFICTVLIYFLLPKFAIYGYIFILYASEIFNFSLSILKLCKITRLKNVLPDVIKSLIAVLGAVNTTELIFNATCGTESAAGITVGIIVYFIIYTLLLAALNAIGSKEFKTLLSAVK